jgi:hypothetical protein
MSIVMSIIKGFIGDWGVNAVKFYFDNSLYINGVLLLYALLISICWKNYQKINIFLVKSITSQIETKVKKWNKSEINRNIVVDQIPWEAAIKLLKLPFLAKSGNFIPFMASKATIEKLFPLDELILSIIETNKKQEV